MSETARKFQRFEDVRYVARREGDAVTILGVYDPESRSGKRFPFKPVGSDVQERFNELLDRESRSLVEDL